MYALYLSITLSIFLTVLTMDIPRLTLDTLLPIPLGVTPFAKPTRRRALSSFMGTPAMAANDMICCVFVERRYLHMVSCVSSSSIRFTREERTDLASPSMPPPPPPRIFFLRRDFPAAVVSGGASRSPSNPSGLPPSFAPPVMRELSREDEKSPDDPALPDGISGLFPAPPIPSSIPSKNEFEEDVPAPRAPGPSESPNGKFPNPPLFGIDSPDDDDAAPLPSLIKRP
mmetsp:Transcript_29595/g.63777  ORF Transcript_29595/g.63777 Transcript_29595/m.63777 type:complete len:228 (-) Transcript_29595:442-1125(-)